MWKLSTYTRYMRKCCDSCFLYGSPVSAAILVQVCCKVSPRISVSCKREKDKEAHVVLTLSYLMDLWLCRKFCPSFEVRRSGGEEERFASGACSCVMVCYWEFFPTHRDTNNSLVSLNLWPTWMEEIRSQHFYSYARSTPRKISQTLHAWLLFSLFFFFLCLAD